MTGGELIRDHQVHLGTESFILIGQSQSRGHRNYLTEEDSETGLHPTVGVDHRERDLDLDRLVRIFIHSFIHLRIDDGAMEKSLWSMIFFVKTERKNSSGGRDDTPTQDGNHGDLDSNMPPGPHSGNENDRFVSCKVRRCRDYDGEYIHIFYHFKYQIRLSRATFCFFFEG